MICIRTLCIALLLFTNLLISAYGDALRTVAISGQSAIDIGGGVVFNGFSDHVINDKGQSAFRGFLAGRGVIGLTSSGVWSEGRGTLALVIRRGDFAPGTDPGFKFSDFLQISLNNEGLTSISGTITDIDVISSNNDNGIWLHNAATNQLHLVIRSGSVAPDTDSGVVYSRVGAPALSDNGAVAFGGTLEGNGIDNSNNRGIWSGDIDGGLHLVARKGDRTPSIHLANEFDDFSGVAINASGQTAFIGEIVDNFSTRRGIWATRNNQLLSVAERGIPAPGLGDETTFRTVAATSFPNVAINSLGNTAFLGILSGATINSNSSDGNASGIWSESQDSGLELLVRANDAVPGMELGVEFAGFGDPVLNDEGKLAFTAFLRGTNVDPRQSSASIWKGGGGDDLTLVVRSGTAAPGTQGDAKFIDFHGTTINKRGQVAFVGQIRGDSPDSIGQLGIWAENESGDLQLIALTGAILDVSDGTVSDFRTVSSLSFIGSTGNGDGRPSAFNDLGQLAFTARFTDGTEGAFVSTLVAIPEPSTMLIAFAAFGPLLCRSYWR
ncbi:DUF7453 family protein [Bythopirellula goksoeyrii]|uniref:Uncharacterized protein n=1 Tax=Bythopirellula goksoeyrii TaxID=1400387 RepID=A0A5B9QFW4_9BACT|nr:choice-of-anchor tandem repeat NxxGxxAF-containing protein [Bythopirellula goksoeyrii]QEG37918.1 hypothetical protein Pr1d_52660 [Bythopirellula goksoeyrii]